MLPSGPLWPEEHLQFILDQLYSHPEKLRRGRVRFWETVPELTLIGELVLDARVGADELNSHTVWNPQKQSSSKVLLRYRSLE